MLKSFADLENRSFKNRNFFLWKSTSGYSCTTFSFLLFFLTTDRNDLTSLRGLASLLQLHNFSSNETEIYKRENIFSKLSKEIFLILEETNRYFSKLFNFKKTFRNRDFFLKELKNYLDTLTRQFTNYLSIIFNNFIPSEQNLEIVGENMSCFHLRENFLNSKKRKSSTYDWNS